MKRFQFSLETVLDYRENIEDEKKGQLALALQKAAREERILESINNEKKESRNNCEGFDAVLLQQQESYLSFLDKQLRWQKKKLAEAEKAVEQYREVLLEASKEKRVLENLKSRRQEEHNDNLLKNEQKELDELGAAAYCRKKAE